MAPPVPSVVPARRTWPSMLARGAWHRGIGLLALAGAGNCVAALLAYRFALNPGGIVVVWAPAGFALALLVLTERERWPFAIVGAVVGTVIR